MTRATILQKLSLSAATLVIAGSLGAYLLHTLRPEPPTVELVDTSAELEALYEKNEDGEEIVMPGVSEFGADFARRLAERVDEEAAAAFFPALRRDSTVFHPFLFHMRAPAAGRVRKFSEHPDGGYERRVNSLGMREDADPGPARPDLRILVTGDSHIEGICANVDSFPNLLEARLADARPERTVEVWNTAQGGFSFPNYLGLFDAYDHLEPDVAIVVVYGGNDFRGTLAVFRYVYQWPRTGASEVAYDTRALQRSRKDGLALIAQEVGQVLYFEEHPELEPIARDIGAGVLVELARRYAARGAKFLAVYLPPPTRSQPQHYEAAALEALRQVNAPLDALEGSDRIADQLLALLKDHGVPALDLRPSFRAASERLFWRTDLHLNLAGHRLVAEEVERALEGL